MNKTQNSPMQEKKSEKSKNSEKTKKAKEKNYFEGHSCTLPHTKLTQFQVRCSRGRKLVLDWIAVRIMDIRAQYIYRSYASISAEKYHQYNSYAFSIHPYSKYRLCLESFIVLCLLVGNFVIPAHYSYYRDLGMNLYTTTIISIIDIFYIINILSNMLTGYTRGNTSVFVELNLKKIMLKYLRSGLIPDVASTAGLVFWNYAQHLKVDMILFSLKMLRIPTLFKYTDNILTTVEMPIFLMTLIETLSVILCYIEWNVFFQFGLDYEYRYGHQYDDECSFLKAIGLWNTTSTNRFIYCIHRSVHLLRQRYGTQLMVISPGCHEYFYAVSWTIAKLIILYCIIRFVMVSFGLESARAKYFVMSQQVKKYMQQGKFPSRLKKKILKFYALKFHSHFFVEARMLECVSGQLREDIMMHTGLKLESHAPFLNYLPKAKLLELRSKLTVVLFLAGDIIFKINTIGDCLYFIDKGTVAIYSKSGKEICHLEDGDFFGEIALIMKQRTRTASVVATTNCELFRLDRQDFKDYIECYPSVYDDIKQIATVRMTGTRIMDEHHKAEMNMLKPRDHDIKM